MKTANQEQIQKLLDEGNYAPAYPIVTESNLSYMEKALVTQMLNDIHMNGEVTWKHETYASKLNSSRSVILRTFKKFVETGLLLAHEDNKPGSKSNKFDINLKLLVTGKPDTSSNMLPLEPETSGSEPVTSGSEPVTSGHQPVTSGSKPVTSSVHIKKTKETNKENNKESLKKDFNESSFYVSNDISKANQEYFSKKEEVSKTDMEIWLQSIDI